jgi:diguanylate cyclase (GGDEF)-like protein/PAS domain S-box-containing protein
VYLGVLIASATRAAAKRGARTIAIQTQHLAGADPLHIRGRPNDLPRIGWDEIDGFVVIINSVPRSYLEQLKAAGKPVVLISHEEEGFACPMVGPDNRSGVTEAVRHLLDHGHRRVAFAGDLTQYDIQERFEAYRETLRANGVDPEPELCFPTTTNLEQGGRDAARQMIEAGLPSTAVFAATDYNAVGIIAALTEAGYSVPRDQAVVGFDNMPGAALLSPALSTIGQPFEVIGARAVDLLAAHLGGRTVEPGHYLVRTSFLARESCGCVRTPVRNRERAADDPVSEFIEDLKATFDGQDRPPGATHAGPAALGPGEQATGGAARVAELGLEMAQAFRAATDRSLSPVELLRLSQICQDLYRFQPSPRAHDLVVLARRLARALEARAGPNPATGERIDQCVQQVSIGVSGAGVTEQARLNQLFRASVWNQHNIGMELLSCHERGPRSLAWMARTSARQAVLALWAPAGQSTELEVVGTYDVADQPSQLSGRVFKPEVFPPVELVEGASHEPEGGLVLVLPVKTPSSDWGYLALVAPSGAALAAEGTYFEWSALLSQALDYDAVTSSLRQRNRDLAGSYRREREMAEAVRQSEERYALAARAANDGLWDWDLAANSIYFSPRWKQMLGYDEQAISDNPDEWLSRVHPEDRKELMGALAEHRRGKQGPFEVEHRVRAADGSFRWVLCRGLCVPDGGRPATRVVGSLADINERRALEKQLVHQALHDHLTGLPNRALFLDRLSQCLAYARRSPGYEYAVLWLDLDGFKVVNDSLGHIVGDKLLARVARRICNHLREADTAARLGGDEFALLLHRVPDFSVVEGIVGRLRADLSRPYDLDGYEVVVTASIGIATSANDYDRAEDVLRDADIAMYRAKSAGRNGYMTFDTSMYAGVVSRLQTETALRQAIDRGQFELHYQLIVDLADGALRAMEALARWHHPVRGLLAPAEFLAVAEESGLIVPMGRWALTESCRQLREWKQSGLVAPALRMSVNLSNREFWDPSLLAQVDQVLASTGASPEWVTFEITEGVVMHDVERAKAVLAGLHYRGIQVHIDDFGTGYSSLDALHRLPLDALKIDRSFVANLQDNKSTELVRTIIQLGRNLGVDVIAEGIETPAQRYLLASLGCRLGQGYWFSVPLPAGQLGPLLETGLKALGTLLGVPGLAL